MKFLEPFTSISKVTSVYDEIFIKNNSDNVSGSSFLVETAKGTKSNFLLMYLQFGHHQDKIV
jgi:hypothetical protein